ncbi:MAG: lysophospholipid acyltransferase family protein [Halioglobus sp.]
MPEFYLIPKRLARKAPFLVTLSQRLEGAIFRSIFWVLRRLSLERASAIAAAAFGLVGPHTDKARKAEGNLAIAFPESTPEWRRQTVRQIFRNLGIAAVELVKMDQIWEQRAQRLEFVLRPGAQKHLESGGATVFVCAHVGPWQITNLIGRQCGLTVSTIYAPESNPVMRDLMATLRDSFGVKWISSDAGARPLVKELSAGHCIGMAMDTRLDTGKLIPFFGRDALTNTSAAGLALRTGAALLPIRSERLPGGRFRVTVYDPITPENPDNPPKELATELTARINKL